MLAVCSLTSDLANFFGYVSLHRATKVKIDKLNYNKLKGFSAAKETNNKVKRPPTEWEKIIPNAKSDKDLIFKTYQQIIQLNIQKPNNPIFKMSRGPE